MHADLVVHAGNLFRGQGPVEGAGYAAVKNDRIESIGLGDFPGTAERVLSFPDGLLLPGLVDLHAHPGSCGESKYGTNPDEQFLPRGVTTVMSQGDAGAHNWQQYCTGTLAQSQTRIRMALNLAAPGEVPEHACFERMEDVNVEDCVAAIEGDATGAIWGIAINVSRIACADSDPREVMRRGLEVAERVQRPILYGMREPADWPLDDQLGQLRSGDVVTYCFRPPTVTIVQDGRVDPAVWAARERGVLFDLGHGLTSFNYETATTALREGFLPDTISTDQYSRHEGSSPPHSLPLTASKLMAAGMAAADVWPRMTLRPAEVLGLADEVGSLQEGKAADLCVLKAQADCELLDTEGNARVGDRWEACCVVRGGKVIVAR